MVPHILVIWASFIWAGVCGDNIIYSPIKETPSDRVGEGMKFQLPRGANLLGGTSEHVESLYCSSFSAEPSVWEIISGTTPMVIKSNLQTFVELPLLSSYLHHNAIVTDALKVVVSYLSSIRLPVRAIFGSGKYRISFNEHNLGDFSAVELFTTQPYIVRSACTWMSSNAAHYPVLHLIESRLCSCSEGVMAERIDGATGEVVSGCMLHPCTSRDAHEGLCRIEVDALSNTCIYGPKSLNGFVAYELVVPSMQILPSVSSSVPPSNHMRVPPGWISGDSADRWRRGRGGATSSSSLSSAVIVIPIRAARLVLALLFMRISYARRLLSSAAKFMMSVWAALTISAVLTAWNDAASIARNIQAAQGIVRSDLSEVASFGAKLWLNLWHFDARALFATASCLIAVEVASLVGAWRERRVKYWKEEEAGEEDDEYLLHDSLERHPLWLSLLSFAFSLMAYTVIGLTFENAFSAIFICILLSISARRLYGTRPRVTSYSAIDLSDDITRPDYNRVQMSAEGLSSQARSFTERSLRQLKNYLLSNSVEYDEVMARLNTSGKSNRAHLLKCFRGGSYKGVPELRGPSGGGNKDGHSRDDGDGDGSMVSSRSFLASMRWMALIAVLVYFVSAPEANYSGEL